jgi:large subunit ribosomal protein L3
LKALITRKVGMTSVINEEGAAIGITLLSATPNTVTGLKSTESNGYNSIQLGFEKTKKLPKPQTGQLKESKATPKVIKEFRVNELGEVKVGDQLTAETFEIGDTVDVIGISKGKGFAGTIKRHNFHRGPKTHGGQSYRRPGSIGSMFPQNIRPGKKMAGQMGHEKVTTKRLKVALVDKELAVIGVTGSVPGPRRGLVLIKETK